MIPNNSYVYPNHLGGSRLVNPVYQNPSYLAPINPMGVPLVPDVLPLVPTKIDPVDFLPN
jgi:hypothetical protein